VNWFEQNVNDSNRAKQFYEATLKTTRAGQMESCRMGMFPFGEKNGVGSAHTNERRAQAARSI
jgi:predicted enzyme related to lactoylglutathione lyase